MSSVPLAITGLQAVAAVAAVAWLLIGALAWYRGRLTLEQKLISLAAIVGLALFASGALASLPQPIDVIEKISSTLGKWTYLFVTVMAFLETGAFVGLVAPGEATVVIGGVVAGQGEIDIRLLIGLVWMAAFLGDSASFYLGHRLGRDFLVRHGPRVKITEQRLVQVERYMHDHGGKTILVGRFVGLVRALAPFIAGSSKMSYRAFVPYDVIGSGLWAATFCLLGYFFSNNLDAVIHWAERGALVFGWTIAVIVAVIYLVQRFRKAQERAKVSAWLDEQEQIGRRGLLIRPVRRTFSRVVMPVAHFFGPQLRFAWERFTPGRLGLEFTTVMAALMTGAYTLYFFTVAAVNWPTEFTTRLNNAAFRIASSIRTDWLDTLAEAITKLGAFPVAAVFTLIAAAYCLRRRRIAETLVLVLSLAIAGLLVSAMKEWVALPRPDGSLVNTLGLSYPSGHSAYAITYVSIAITLQRVRDIVVRMALVGAAIALAATIGLTRVYLRAHYLTDVIGGVALTVTITALLAAIALLVLHVRLLRAERATAPAAGADIVD